MIPLSSFRRSLSRNPEMCYEQAAIGIHPNTSYQARDTDGERKSQSGGFVPFYHVSGFRLRNCRNDKKRHHHGLYEFIEFFWWGFWISMVNNRCRLRPAGLPGSRRVRCAAVAGTTTETTRAAPTGTGTIPTTGTTTSVFGWCARPTSFPTCNGADGRFNHRSSVASAPAGNGYGSASGNGRRPRFAARGAERRWRRRVPAARTASGLPSAINKRGAPPGRKP